MKFFRAVVTSLLALLAGGNTVAKDSSCDRTCLNGMVDRFLGAVVAKDPSRAPLWVGFRETVNSVLTPAGEGIWRTVSSFDPADRRFFDPETGNAAVLGLLKEGDARAIVSLRLRVQEGRVSEAEWHVARRNDLSPQGVAGELEMFDPSHMLESVGTARVVPRSERVSREALIAIANSYFDGLSSADGHVVIAHPGCSRTENGLKVVGFPLKPSEAGQGFNGLSDCMTGYDSLAIALVQARRYPLVDEEQQVALGSGVFVRKPGENRRRNHLMEYFYVDHGKLRHIEAALFYADPSQVVPNWPPYDGNFALPLPLELPH